MIYDEVNHRVLGVDSRLLIEAIAIHRIRWLGHALHLVSHFLLFRALFARTGQGWKMRPSDQAMA